MTRPLLGAATLVAAAVVVGVPVPAAAGRLRALRPGTATVTGGSRGGVGVGDAGTRGGAGAGGGADVGVRTRDGAGPTCLGVLAAAVTGRSVPGGAPGLAGVPAAVVAVPVAAAAAVPGGLLGGAVGATVIAAYAAGGTLAAVRGRRERGAEAARLRCAEALAGLADDLRAGRPPLVALRAALSPLGALPGVAAVLARIDAEGTASALRAARGPLAPALHRLAAAWALTDAGIPLAEVVDRLDEEMRADRQAARRAAVRTASARTTARLVAGLPVVGLAMGQALGADPLRVLTGTPAGAACAVAATALHLLGFAWAGRIARGAVPRDVSAAPRVPADPVHAGGLR